VTDPSGSVEVCGGIVVNDCATLVSDVDEMVLTVPDMVVREPLGSVDVVGGILMTEGLDEAELGRNVSVVPGIVVGDPFGRVEVVGRIVLTDGSDGLPVGMPVKEVELPKGLVFVPDITQLGGVDPLNELVLVPDMTLLEEVGPLNGFVFDPDMKLLNELEIEVESDDELVGEDDWRIVGDVPYL
jgi:hypothetical protein